MRAAATPNQISPRARGFGRLGAIVFVAATLSACGAQSESTETGNPPLVAANADKIQVREEDGTTRVIGKPGAVDPGSATVVVTHVSDGEKVTVNAKADGSFAAEVSGSVDDEYRVEVRAAGEKASLTLASSADGEPDATAEASVEQRACEKICGGPSECGANEPLFPVQGCDCDDSVCECTEEECVAACLSDLDGYRAQGLDCGAAMDGLHQCFLAVPCELIAERDTKAINMLPECRNAIGNFEENCYFGPANSCGLVLSGGSGTFESPETISCDIQTTCGATNYSLDCTLLEPGTSDYNCVCREDGARAYGFNAQSDCGFDEPEAEDESLRYLSFRCGWDLPLSSSTLDTSTCDEPEFSRTAGDAGTSCFIGASCAGAAYAVSCEAEGEGVRCACSRDGERVAETLLDADGCFGAYGLTDDETLDTDVLDADVLRAMQAICPW